MKPLERIGESWTTEERLTVCEIFDAGKNLEEICRAVGRPASTVVQVLLYAKRITQVQTGHYYIMHMWCAWQEVRNVTDKLRAEAAQHKEEEVGTQE